MDHDLAKRFANRCADLARQARRPSRFSKILRYTLLATALITAMRWTSLATALGKFDNDNDRDPADSNRVRQLIDRSVGGIDKLKVPATDAELPAPRDANGAVLYRFEQTEAKRYLGKLLFHDPVRTARIDPKYGAVPATAQTGSCASCHLGETDSKAGQRINFNLGGEGRGYTDEDGNFFARRRPRTDLLPRLRQAPIFEGDALVDHLPTLTDVLLLPPCTPGTLDVTTPARNHKLPAPCTLVGTGRLDALDSVGRISPSLIGFAFNNRLLLGGFAGELNSAPGGFNPPDDPAQENLTLLLTDAHRIFTDNPLLPGELPYRHGESPILQKIPAFIKLFRDAFPVEAAQADSAKNINLLVNDDTAIRATSTFLRAAVTRDTPFDRFLAGDNRALTERQLRGARLFFTPATNGAGGAGCVRCHAGPMLNKQPNDPDVTGVGRFVEQNFINVGIGDHPIQELNRVAAKDPNRHDFGRGEITLNTAQNFQFRSLTMRQLKEAVNFFHDANPRFATVRDVVEYFNAGIPEDPIAGAQRNLDTRFTYPRGPKSPRGLGLSKEEVDDIADFLENGLYDPAFSHYDPRSPTPLFNLNPKELAYSTYRPDLAALGAKDGLVISGLAMDDNDPLARRDEGFAFLDVTNRVIVSTERLDRDDDDRGDGDRRDRDDRRQIDRIAITNHSTPPSIVLPLVTDSASVIDTNLLVIVKGLDRKIRLANASGTTKDGDPYLRIFLPNGVLNAGETITRKLRFQRRGDAPSLNYTLQFLSGQGKP